MAKKEKKADAPSSFELGCVREAWLALERCTTRIADQHVALSTSVRSKLVDPLAQFVKDKESARKEAVQIAVSSGKTRADVLADALKHATACDKLAVELHELEQAAQHSASAKATAKRDAARERIAGARQKLAAAQQKAAQADQQYFAHDLPHALRAIELFENNRVHMLQALLGEYVEIENHLAHTITRQALPELSAVVDTIDSVGYIEALMRIIASTPNPNAPIPLAAVVPTSVDLNAPTPTPTPTPQPTSQPVAEQPSPTLLGSLSLLSVGDAPAAAGVVVATPPATPSAEELPAAPAPAPVAEESTTSKYKNLLSMKAWRATVRRSEPDKEKEKEKAAPIIVVTPDERVNSGRFSKPTDAAPVSAPLPILASPRATEKTTVALDDAAAARTPASPEPASPVNPKRGVAKTDDLASSSPSSSGTYGSLKRGNWKEKMMAAMDRTTKRDETVDAADAPASTAAAAAATVASPAPAVSAPSTAPSSPPTSVRVAAIDDDDLEDIPL